MTESWVWNKNLGWKSDPIEINGNFTVIKNILLDIKIVKSIFSLWIAYNQCSFFPLWIPALKCEDGNLKSLLISSLLIISTHHPANVVVSSSFLAPKFQLPKLSAFLLQNLWWSYALSFQKYVAHSKLSSWKCSTLPSLNIKINDTGASAWVVVLLCVQLTRN